MIRKIFSVITIAVFVLMAFLPVYGLLLPGSTAVVESENRNAESFDADVSLSELPSEMETYFNDRFAFRSELLSLHNDINARFGSSSTDRAIEGLDGWYYYMAEGSREDIMRTGGYSQEEIDAICTAQQNTSDYLESRGIEYYLMVCPDKHTVYPEYLPMTMRVQEGDSRFEPLAKALKENTDVNFIDARDAVIAAKGEKDLFFKTDTHWNGHGAFIGYSQLAERIEQDVEGFVNIKAEDCDITEESWTYGDLVQMLGRTGLVEDTLVKYTPKGASAVEEEHQRKYSKVSVHSDQIPRIYENPKYPDGPVCVVFRDSFFNDMIPLLNESGFSRIVYIWTREMLIDVIEAEDPDVVIEQHVERLSPCAITGLDAVAEQIVDYEAGEKKMPMFINSMHLGVEYWDLLADILIIRGSAYYNGHDGVPGSKHFALKKGDEIVWCPTVSTFWVDDRSNYGGFTATVDKSKLSPGTWEMIMVYDDGDVIPGCKAFGKSITIK